MKKEEIALQNRLLDVLEQNSKVLGSVFDLLIQLTQGKTYTEGANLKNEEEPENAGNKADEKKKAEPEKATKADKKPEPEKKTEPKNKADAPKEITLEYCRKAISAVSKLIGDEKAREFLKSFDGATKIPDLKKEQYPAFIAAATKIVKENS